MKKIHAILCGATLCTSLCLTPKIHAFLFNTNIEKEIDEFDQFFKVPEISIQETMQKEHENLRKKIENFNKKIEDIFNNQKTTHEKDGAPAANRVIDEINKFSPILQEQKKTFENIKNKEQVASKYKIDIQETDKKIEINIFLPDFIKDEIITTIEDKTEKETSNKRLVITAKKTQQKKDKEKETRVLSYQQFSSFKSINGQEQSIQYKNGQVQISIDLPKYADVDTDYEMEFKDHKLVIKFLKLTKKDKKRLSFTN
ncbi:MAG: hypothetical protein ABH827_01220 [bacterium]